MKGYIIVDIPVDDPAEIDEYTMMANVEVYPCTLSTEEKYHFVLHHVDIRPFPCKRETKAHWINENGKEIITTEPSDYDRGRNDLIDEMKEGTEYRMKPTREEIEHRAVEILLNSKVHYCRLCNKKNSIACNATCVSSVMELTLEKAEEELSKPQLTEDEKVISRNIDKKYKWIARDFDGDLFVYGQKPYVLGKIWTEYTKMYNALPVSCFKFITWEDGEPYSIAELLGEDDD